MIDKKKKICSCSVFLLLKFKKSNRNRKLTKLFCSFQRVTSFLLGWQPFLGPRTARLPTRSSPSAMLWECPTSRPSGSIKCPTTRTPTMSACTPTSPPSAEPSSTSCTSSSGEQSLWSMTTAQVQVQSVSFNPPSVFWDDKCVLFFIFDTVYTIKCFKGGKQKRRGTR